MSNIMIKNKTIVFASIITVAIISSIAVINTVYAESEAYQNPSPYYDEDLSWSVENHKYKLERIKIIEKAHNAGIVSDKDYFDDLLNLWDMEQSLIDTMTYYNLDDKNGKNAKWIKDAIKNTVAQDLIDELISSQ